MSTPGEDENSTVDVYVRLNLLAMHLKVHGFVTEPVAGALVVRNPCAPGCCEGQRVPADKITCRPREGDGGRYWYYTSWQQPIAEADRITDALMVIKGYLEPPA